MNWFRRLRDAPVTSALIVANVLVYAIMAVVSRQLWSFDGDTLIAAGASVSGTGVEMSHWRWLTAAFIHANLLHIVMNLWVLGQIGALEDTPILSRSFESSVPGLYFIGTISAYQFGPVTRFVCGAKFTARRVAKHLARAGA